MITVIKANGEKEPFSEDKLRNSIQRAGIENEFQNELVRKIKEQLYDNIPTSKIYDYVIRFLDDSNKPMSGKYSLKKAIMDLGPSGYPFEDFIAEVLKRMGFTTKTRVAIAGSCINHEVDVVAEKDGKKIMVEAKFHNLTGTKTKVHVALYTKARFDDIKERSNLDEAWIVTNTKTTTDVIDYARCSGMHVISWDFPNNGSLRDLIEKSRLHPVTALTSLSFSQKQQLLSDHVVLCKDIYDNEALLDVLHLDKKKKQAVLSEAKFLYSI